MMRLLFLAHLIAPLLLVVEMIMRWAFPNTPPGADSLMGRVEYFVLVGAVAWVLLGIAAAIRLSNESLGKSMISIVSVYACVAGAFVVLTGPNPSPSLWPANRTVILTPDPQYLPGLEGAAAFTTNDIGIRGDAWPGDGAYTVMAIGGSTTESLYLDDSETWPSLLMDRWPGTWVGNAGQSGRNAIDHLTLMETMPVIRQADMLIFLIGVNELQPSITFAGAPTETILQANTLEFQRQVENGGRKPGGSMAALKTFKLYEAFTWSSVASRFGISPHTATSGLGMGSGLWFETLRERRRSASTLPIPDLSAGREEYEHRILNLHDRCDQFGTRCVFLTQPSLWRYKNDSERPNTQAEEDLFWLGWVGPLHQSEGYVSATDLARGMGRINSQLLTTCVNHGLECYDLASAVPKTAENFYDDVHLTEAGSRLVAEWLSRALDQQPDQQPPEPAEVAHPGVVIEDGQQDQG